MPEPSTLGPRAAIARLARLARLSVVALVLVAAACGADGAGAPGEPQTPAGSGEPALVTATRDCTAGSPQCVEITVVGDTQARMGDGRAAPARGYADPSIRRHGRTLWMAYSWTFPELTADAAGRLQLAVRVESHLARSADGGASWRFARELWQSTPAVDESGAAGWLNSEVLSLAPRDAAGGDSVWYAVRLRYFVGPDGAPRPTSFTLQLSTATSAELLAAAPEASLGGALTVPHWRPTTNLAALAGELSGCTWNDPGLLYHDDTLYLAVQCSLFGPGAGAAEREFVALFATTPDGPAAGWSWRYLGKLAGHAEARELGGEMLMQTDLAVGASGRLVAIFSPSAPATPLAAHFGCRVVEVESLRPPRLARAASGQLRVLASVTATDLLPGGPGACAYDAGSTTGVVIVRRVQQPGQLLVSLHASRVRP